jgi:hypothetical protein
VGDSASAVRVLGSDMNGWHAVAGAAHYFVTNRALASRS